uniref:NADH-cytochrome b5 reductase (EC) n=1 Tax=Ganoderma boninense TaxID=34458 RepID=A0A5K1JTD7_9APHY|nr:NADH-cytochrome b5 reductase (EC [Ganoderma boninense]
MADVPYDYSFVPPANHTNNPNSGLLHARSLSIHCYPPYQHIREPISHFDPFADAPRSAHNDPGFLPTLEFRVPILPQAFHLPQEYHSRPRPALPSWLRSRYDDHVTGVQGKGILSQTPAPTTHSVPLSVPVSLGLPVALPVAVPVPLSFGPNSPGVADLPFPDYPTTTSQGDDIALKTETPPLALRDITSTEPPTKDIPPYPSPVVAQDYPDLFAPTLSQSDEVSHDATFAVYAQSQVPMPPWSPPASSLPSLSYGSPSSSEHSYTLSVKELPFDGNLRLSLSPPPFTMRKVNEDTLSMTPTLGIIVDVNMREQALAEQEPVLCVNPADIMAGFIRSSGPSPEASPKLDDDNDYAMVARSQPALVSHTSSAGVSNGPSGIPARQLSPLQDYNVHFPAEALVDSQNFPEEAISAIVSVLKSSSTNSEVAPPASVCPGSTVPSETFGAGCEVVAPRPVHAQSGHTYPGSDLGMLRPDLVGPSGGIAAAGPSNTCRNRVPLGDIRAVQLQYTSPPYVSYPPAFPNTPSYAFPPPPPVPQQLHAPLVDPPKPVLNAHVGIQLEELRQRAAEYRAQHPSAELDKAFLQSFAGRLSARGELLDDYRCYVVGCGQRNKRRDHILVHVGSHVEHRPWACQHCGMKFLRKNECKRHESSHEGRKPFSCQICAPFQDRSFVRQDLLKRHLRVSHGVHDTMRKRSQYKKDDVEYWP